MSGTKNFSCGPCGHGTAMPLSDIGDYIHGPSNPAPTDISEARNPSFRKFDKIWKDHRIAIDGQDSAREHAVERGWVEVPEHLAWLRINGSQKEKTQANKAISLYVERAEYPDIISFARDITRGRILRDQPVISGLFENETVKAPGVIREVDLDRAYKKSMSFRDFIEFLIDEKFTTRWTFMYVYTNSKDEAEFNTYTAENVWDLEMQSGEVSYVVFRETRSIAGENRFDRHKKETVYRELIREEFAPNQYRVIERVWTPVKDKKDKFEVLPNNDRLLKFNDKALSRIPVVVDGGACPTKSPYAALLEKTKRLMGLTANIAYREFRIANPWLWINYETSTGRICSANENRGEAQGANPSAKVAVAGAAKKSTYKRPLVPGMGALETQEAGVQWLVDRGEGVAELKESRDHCIEQMNSMGARFGVKYTGGNISTETERMQASGETAYIISHIYGTEKALTELVRWLAFFRGVDNNEKLMELDVKLNKQLVDEGKGYDCEAAIKLYDAGLAGDKEAYAMLHDLLPEIYPETDKPEEMFDRINQARLGLFAGQDVETPDEDLGDTPEGE